MTSNQFYIGLMSGTSADAIDVVLVDFSTPIRLLEHHTQLLSSDIRARIHGLCIPGENEIDLLGTLDVELAELFASAIKSLLEKAQIPASLIMAIGSHGQTIRHRPPNPFHKAFTLQIGDPNTIAQLTGITTVADFRRRDMALGGQGAPLVPAFHRAMFQSSRSNRVIVNIGGMSNITWLAANGEILGFDTGPGNVLMDSWILEHQDKNYDRDGSWAASGQAHPELTGQLLNHTFFAQCPPKSTGREVFNMAWLRENLAVITPAPSPVDIQASLLELTAQSITQSIQSLSHGNQEVFVCGGGAYNQQLMKRLQDLLGDCPVKSTSTLGIAPEWVEAMAFAWLAQQTLNRKPGNVCAVTGAKEEAVLGGIYYA